MAVKMFMKIGEIKGESADDKHRDEIEVLTWSWGVTDRGLTQAEAGREPTKRNMQALHFTKYIDSTSPVLMKFCLSGRITKDATLTALIAESQPRGYLIMRMVDVLISSVSMAGSGSEGGLTETVTLTFARVGVTYQPQKIDGSMAGDPITMGWDFGVNSMVCDTSRSTTPVFRGAGRGRRRGPECATTSEPRIQLTDQVHFTVTAPSMVAPNNSYVLDVWAHLADQRGEVIDRAREAQGRKEIVSRTKGEVLLERGIGLIVRIALSAFRIVDAEDIMTWTGEIGNATFSFGVPPDTAPGGYPGAVYLHAGALLVAKLHFVITVSDRSSTTDMLPTRELRHRSAFASYANEDRDEVLGRVQGMQKILPALDVFLDVAGLRSGENWQDRVLREVTTRDVFYLFWSEAASRSRWVEMEWQTALSVRGMNYIDPVPLVSPEVVPPPRELMQMLHFNDWVLAYRRSAH